MSITGELKDALNDNRLFDKVEEALWELCDEGTFGWGTRADDLIAEMTAQALVAVEEHLMENTND